MAESKKLIPKRRFKEFQDSEAWEHRTLGELADVIGGGTPRTSNPEYWDGDIDWYSPVEIGEQIFVDGSQKKITELGLQKSSAKILPVGTVLFTSRAGIGNTAILAKEGATNQGFQSIVPHENELDSYYIYSRTHELKSYGENNGAGSTFVEVSGKQMAKMPVLTPSMEEQKKIGTFFSHLDNLITLQQRKLEKVKALKAAYLSEMFPVEGEREPKRRFKGFTGDWEERKLGKLYTFRYGQFNNNPSNGGKYPVFGANGVIGGYTGYNAESSVIIGHMGEYAGSVLWGEGKHFVTYNGTIARSNQNELESKFGYYMLCKHNIRKTCGGSGLPFLSYDMLEKMDAIYPKSKKEQERILNFFSHLDDIITLHQRKLEKLQNIKKAYLNEMFI